MIKQFVYPIISYDVLDGDSVKILMDRGFQETKRLSVRVVGIDSPETRTRNLLEKRAGKLVTSVATQWMAPISTPMFHSQRRDKYAGRGIGDLYDADFPDDTLSKYLLSVDVVEAYDGGKKKKWSNRRLREIIKNCLAMLG